MLTGTITDHEDDSTITFERRLPFPVQDVWAALTEQDQLNQWFSAGTIEHRQDGVIELAGPKNVPVTGTVLVWDPPRVLELDWRQHNVGQTTVRYELTPDGDHTVLTLTHSGLRHNDARGYTPGQHASLDRLTAFLSGAEIPGWEERYREVQHLYPTMVA